MSRVAEPSVIRVVGRSSRIEVRAVAGADLVIDGGRVVHQPDGVVEVDVQQLAVKTLSRTQLR